TAEISSNLRMLSFSTVSEVTASIVFGTSRRLSSRRRAVTMISSSVNPAFSPAAALLLPAIDAVCAPAADATAKRPDPASALNVRALIQTPCWLIAKAAVTNACPLAGADWPNQIQVVNLHYTLFVHIMY